MAYMQSFKGANPQGITDEMCNVYADKTVVMRLSDCIPDAGIYTLQFWIRSATESSIYLETSGLYKVIEVTSEWVKHVYTFTATGSDSAIYIQFPAGVYYLYHVKQEMDDTASDWTLTTGDASEPEGDTRLFWLSDKYTDKLGCNNRLWYIERNTECLTLGGSGSWTADGEGYRYSLPQRGEENKNLPAASDQIKYGEELSVYNADGKTHIWIKSDRTSVDDFKAWLAGNPVTVLLPAETSTVPLANYLQTLLNNITAGDDLTVRVQEDGVHRLRGAVVIEPITFGAVNRDMAAVINSLSDDAIGFVYTIHCTGEVVNPAVYLTETNQHIKINGTYKRDDIISVDTRRGKKSVTKTYRGIETNIINSFDSSSKWLQLQSGYNHLIQSADSGAENMEAVIAYTNEYEGV